MSEGCLHSTLVNGTKLKAVKAHAYRVQGALIWGLGPLKIRLHPDLDRADK